MLLTSYNEATAYGCSTLEKDLTLCEKVGFDYIEIRGDMLLDYLQDHSVDELVEFFKNSHLKAYTINALYSYDNMFDEKKADKNRDRALMAYYLTCCEVARKVGALYFIVVPHLLDDTNNIWLPHDPRTEDYPHDRKSCTEQAVRYLKKLCEIAKRYDIGVSYEPVASRGSSCRSVDHAMEIVNAVGMENLGVTLDPFNLHLDNKRNDFSVMLQIPVEKVYAVHINNCDDKPIEELDHGHRCFVDKGCIDVDNYVSTLKKMGYNGPVSIETFRQEYYEQSAEEVIEKAYITTKELLDKYN